MFTKSLLSATLATTLVSVSASGALVFGSAVEVPNDPSSSVFLNDGNFVISMNVRDGGSTDYTLGGVTFEAGGYSNAALTQTITNGSVSATVEASGGFSFNYPTTEEPYLKTGATDVGDVLSTGLASSGTGSGITIAFSGLTPGETYRLQTLHWINSGTPGSRDIVYTDGTDTSSPFTVIYGGENAPIAGVANTVTFVADAATKTITLAEDAGGDRSYLNGFALYQVPEPGSMGLISLGVIALFGRRRPSVVA